jgi:hypothetical protein
MGSMEPYEFFYPADMDANTIFPGPFDLVMKYPGGTLQGITGIPLTYIMPANDFYDITTGHRDYGKKHMSDGYDTHVPVSSATHDPVAATVPNFPGGDRYLTFDPKIVDPIANKVLNNTLQLFYGKIISGSGETYQVNIFTDNPSSAPKERTVSRLGYLTDTLNNGDWVEVSLNYIYDIGENDELVEIEVWSMLVASGATSVYPGEIVSGSNATYTVNVYLKGLDNSPTSKTVTQLQIDSGETIPAGTKVMCSLNNVIKTGETEPSEEWTMQVAVWL